MEDNILSVKLTKKELNTAEGDKNKVAAMLVEKAVFKEMAKAEYTVEEKEKLKKLKKNLEKEFFLNKKAGEKIVITKEDIETVYNNNIEKLKGMNPEEIVSKIKEKIFLKRLEEERVNYMNLLIKEYNLNDEIKKIFPELNDKTEK